MPKRQEIKVIKRAERRAAEATLSQNGAALVSNKGESGRDAVTVVTGWIRELRQRKVAEATRRFERRCPRALHRAKGLLRRQRVKAK
jgi:hypothetical protein